MAMSKSKNEIEPIFRSTFDPVTDGDGFLINQKNLISQEVSGNSLLVLRTSKSSTNNTKAAKDIFNLKLPGALEMTNGDNDSRCFWISPDEFWVLLKPNHKMEIEEKLASLPAGVSISDNSGAYGILEFTGDQTNNLLGKEEVDMGVYKEDPAKFEEVKTSLFGEQFKLMGRVKMNDMFNRLEFNVQMVEKADAQEEIAKLEKVE